MSATPALKLSTNIFYQSVRNYRTIYVKSKRLNLTPKVYSDVKAPPGVKYNVINRNPRNLERLRIEFKNEGWALEKQGNTFWHKLSVKETASGVVVSVVHKDGHTVISAASNEWPIRKFLYNATDKSAYYNVGRVFARRCLESGLTEMVSTYQADADGKLAILLQQIETGGISLTEPPRLVYEDIRTKVKPQRPWDVVVE